VAEIPALELGIIKGIQVVESPNGVAGKQQLLADMRADKTCAAGDQEVHELNGWNQPRSQRGCQACPIQEKGRGRLVPRITATILPVSGPRVAVPLSPS